MFVVDGHAIRHTGEAEVGFFFTIQVEKFHVVLQGESGFQKCCTKENVQVFGGEQQKSLILPKVRGHRIIFLAFLCFPF